MVGLSSNAPVGVSIASNNNPTQVRWKDLRFLMKCPSKEHVELICEEVFHRRHESIMPSSFVQTHAAVLRLDTSRLDHLYQVLRALFAEIFLVLPNPFTQVIAEDYLRNKVAKLDPRLIELLASILVAKSTLWRDLCISQAPAGPRLVGTKWNLQLKKADILQTPRTVAIIDLQIQDPAINAHVFPETKHLKFELEKSSVDKIVAEFQKIKEQLNGMKVNPATTEVTTNP